MKISPVRFALLLLPLTASFVLPASADSLKERQEKVRAVVDKAKPAVVAIVSESGAGSGVIVSPDGLVLTAGHVVAAAGDEVSLLMSDGSRVKAKSLGRDMDRDAALVQIIGGGNWPHAEMAEGKSVEQGEWCIALGHPGGFDLQRGAPVRLGRLWDKDEQAFYRSDCTVSGGDSGGPLFDLDGKVIGIHSSISMDLSENRHVPIDVFHTDMVRLKKGDRWGDLGKLMPGMRNPEREQSNEDEAKPRSRRPGNERNGRTEPQRLPAPGGARLGVQLDALPDGKGAIVAEVIDGSPAAKAGLQLEDIITGIDGKEDVTTADDVVSAVRSRKPGDKIKFLVRRGDDTKEIEVTLGKPEE